MAIASSNLNGEPSLEGRTHPVKYSALQEMLTIVSQPGILSFALGLPAPELFPKELYAQAVSALLNKDPLALQYGPPSTALKKQIVRLMAERGVSCREEQVFLTSGAQQGMSLLSRLLLNQGGEVLTEEMTYTGLRQVVESFQAGILTVGTDLDTGIDVDAVESLLAEGRRPAFIYTVTDGHNPLGVNMSPAKRSHLAELAARHRVPVVEDDAYGFLHYGEIPTPPLRALEEQWVFYVGSFSKILAPSLRVGWVIVPEAFIHQLSIFKEASDINTATLTQRAISTFLEQNILREHIALLNREYGARRDAMLDALHQSFPRGASWRVPQSGVFIWVELPGEPDMLGLLAKAIEEEKIAFIPGQAFYVGSRKQISSAMRLNFSNSSVERIADGISRLGRLVQRACA